MITTRYAWPAAALTVAALASGCAARPDGGATTVPAASNSVEAPASSRSLTPPPSPTAAPGPGTYGVVETTRRPLTPRDQVCPAPFRSAGAQQVSFVQGSRPTAPTVTIQIPADWTTAVDDDSSTMTLTGPNGVSGSLTVAPTDLGPAEAFTAYADQVTAKAPLTTVSVLPADLCGYSGQKLTGMLSGGGPPVEYSDRIAHVWTAGPSYLIAVHIQGPEAAAAVTGASTLLMDDFGIGLP